MFIVYKTTNKINKKFYIGVHCLEAKKSHKTYFGSGKLIKLALKKYGRENFVVETLFEFNDLKSALDKEKEIVNEEFIKDDTNYNLTVGGSIPPNSKNWWTAEHSKKASNRMQNNSYKLGKKETAETRIKKSNSMRKSAVQGRWQRTEDHRNNLSIKARKQFLENNPMSSEESRKRVGLSKVGRKKMINSEGNWKYVKPEDFSIFLNNGYFFTG